MASLSDQLSILSQQTSALSQAHSALSQAVSLLSQGLSNEISNRTSADNALSQGISVLSQQASVLSQAVSALSQTVSVHSNLISNAISARAVLSNQISALSAGLGGVQRRAVTGAQVISATALTNISGLSISVTSAAVYEINGRVLFTLSILTGTKFGFTYPAAITPGSMTMECLTTVLAAGPINLTSANFVVGRIADTQMSTAATAQISLLGGASGITHALEIYGLVQIGANAGTLQLQAAQSATGGGVRIAPGSFLRAYKVA